MAAWRIPADWRRDLLIEFAGGRSVRSRRYKYSVWEGDRPGELLIDMEKDPGEMTNLAARPEAAAVLDDRRRRLRRSTESLGNIPPA